MKALLQEERVVSEDIMRKRPLTMVFAFLGLVFVMMPAAHADVQIYFTGNTSGGDLDPYQMIITSVGSNPTNGPTQWLNCDDLNDHVTGGESWVADVIYGSDTSALANTLMSWHNLIDPNYGFKVANYNAAIAYDAKAWIELNYGPANNPDYSNAIWRLFANNAPATQLYLDAMAAANADINTGYSTYRQHLTIYTPNLNCRVANACGSQTTGWTDGVPQEFNAVPDGGVTLMLLGGALVGLETLRRRFPV